MTIEVNIGALVRVMARRTIYKPSYGKAGEVGLSKHTLGSHSDCPVGGAAKQRWRSMLRVREYGQSGPHVIVLHGGPGAAGHMAPVARELAGSYRVIHWWRAIAAGADRDVRALEGRSRSPETYRPEFAAAIVAGAGPADKIRMRN